MDLLYGDDGTSETEFSCGMLVWRVCDNGADLGIARALDTQLMDSVMETLFSFMVAVCDWTLIARKNFSGRSHNLSLVQVAEDDASQSFLAVSRGPTTNTKSCDLNAGMFYSRRSQSGLFFGCDLLEWVSSFARSVRMRASNLERSACGYVSPQTCVGTMSFTRKSVGPCEC